jgi:glycosyltransferase involved in cell wall biosynthesis
MLKSDVKLSVCMPVYNGSDFIAKSIESVLAQTYEGFYLNIFDNCSTDSTPDIIKQFNDSRINYYRNEKNIGHVGNQQRCIERCETEYVNIWHDDDIMLPDNLERKMQILEKNSNVGLIFSSVDLIDENDNLLPFKWNEECSKDYIENGRSLFEKYIKMMHFGALFFIGAVIGRNKILTSAGGFSPDFSRLTCDSALWLRALLLTDAACIGEPLVKYRNYTGNTCSEYPGINFLKEHFQVINDVFNEKSEEIPDAVLLKEEITANFIKEALCRGVGAFDDNDLDAAKLHLDWATRISPRIIMKRDYWRLKLRIMLGPKAPQIYNFLKRRLNGTG